jgi:UDP-N-acetylmuramyl pentapeptide phosphotransferase/UDP-N-acetylglucosamine-1-phosphate transferase
MNRIIYLYILPYLFSWVGAWFIGKYGHHFHLLDEPNLRSTHLTARPKGGGIGILAGFITVAIILKLPAAFWVSAAALSIISFMSDRFKVSALFRLLFQVATSIIFLITIWPGHPYSSAGLVLIPFFLIFMVGTTNYFNFMDGINGIAGITGIVAFGLLAFYAQYFNAASNFVILNLSMAICCLGFLPYNFPRAKVFMGDTGSILLGFVFASMVTWLSNSLLNFICLASFLFLFYADEITTAIIRLKDGENLWKPHCRHLYQILAKEHGIAHWKISAGYGTAQLFIGISMLWILPFGIYAVVILFCLYLVLFTTISLSVRKRSIQTKR